MNLIHNAVKYSYKSRKDKFRFVTVNGRTLDKEKFFEIAISNYGVGITPEEIKTRSICEKFVRGSWSSDRERIGTGLGLYVVDQIIKKHSGRLEFTSDPVDEIDGPYLTVFKMILPINQNQ